MTQETDRRHDDALTRDVIAVLDALDEQGKQAVLNFSRDLARRQRAMGPGGAPLAFAGAFSDEDLALIEQAIADGCETVDKAG